MAERNEQVLDRVRQELNSQQDLGSRQLFQLAKGMDPSLESNSLAQFHARYVLPIKREQAAQRAEKEGAAKAGKQRAARPRGRRAQAAEAAGAAEAGGVAEATEQEAPAAAAAPDAAARPAKPARRTLRSRPARGKAEQPQPQEEQQPTVGREQVRAVFLEFALEFAEAESRTEIVQVLSKVDGYVDRVLGQRS